jgi:hypothetical protein
MKRRLPLKAGIALLAGGTIVVAMILEVIDKSLVPDHVWNDFLKKHEELHVN